MKRLFRSRMRFVLIPVLAVGFIFLVGFVVMKLWNYTLPGIFGIHEITLWQAMALFILSKVLFGFGGGKGRGGAPWAKRSMERRFDGMSEEEKEKFKATMRRRMCRWDDDKRAAEPGV